MKTYVTGTVKVRVPRDLVPCRVRGTEVEDFTPSVFDQGEDNVSDSTVTPVLVPTPPHPPDTKEVCTLKFQNLLQRTVPSLSPR